MSGAPVLSELVVGEVFAERSFHVERDSLVRYAGASGDFNSIHYRDDVAAEVGLPGVLAHGMLTMAMAAQVVVDHVEDPGLIVDYSVRFTRPVVVDPRSGADVDVLAKVGAVDVEAGVARIDLVVTVDGRAVLGKAQARLSLS